MNKNKKTRRGVRILWFFAALGGISIAAPILLVLVDVLWRTFGNIEIRWQPVGSMEPTIHGSVIQEKADKIVVDKAAYRFEQPQHGDIVVFRPTEQLQKEQFEDAFTKRIIALPGEKVELRNGKVYINNKQLEEDKYLPSTQYTSTKLCELAPIAPFLSKPQTIPPNSYLVLGDNRGSSYDSRCWGTVPKANIIGKVTKILKNSQ